MFKSFFTNGLDTNFSGLITLGIPSYDGNMPSDAINIAFPIGTTGIDRLLFNNTLETKYRVITSMKYDIRDSTQYRVITDIYYG
jgi:hypothetical protein